MFQIFLCVEYSEKKLNCLKKIILYNLNHMINIVDFIAISVETLRIDSVCFLEKEFTKLIQMNF